jgi:hypothetical protein
MIPVFDYGASMNDDHKAAAEECAKIIEPHHSHVANQIREKFKIVEPEKMDPESSEFYRVAREFGLYPAVQGHMVGPDGVHIPMVIVAADLPKFDEFLQHYKNLNCKD